jgi:uncharacterized protein (TIGR00297 family)
LIVNHPASRASPIDNETMDPVEAKADRQLKIQRESRLAWQSRLLLAMVLPLSAAGCIWRLLTVLTPASAEGLAICAAFGLLVWLLHAATPLAALTGFLLTFCLYIATVEQPNGGWFHTALVPGLALFVLAFAATRFHRGQKEESGLAESRRGRGASQVAANMSVAALAALALPAASHPDLIFDRHSFTLPRPLAGALLAAMVAALAEAAADTVSSEIGQAIGGTPFMITNGRRVPPGADGAITLAGTAAGCIAAALVVLAALPTLRLDNRQAATAWAAAVAGLFADSLLGASLERRGWLNNDSVNLLSTAIAALLALAISTGS